MRMIFTVMLALAMYVIGFRRGVKEAFKKVNQVMDHAMRELFEDLEKENEK